MAFLSLRAYLKGLYGWKNVLVFLFMSQPIVGNTETLVFEGTIHSPIITIHVSYINRQKGYSNSKFFVNARFSVFSSMGPILVIL
ncbi:MAG TPA: hypothetical protein DCG18_02815 [Richelia sp.]|nr:hypothetical protein [Richelia sp.]